MATVPAGTAPARPGISFFERYLTLWVALCIVVGIALGHALPDLFGVIASAEVARVNLVVAVLIWLMIVPMLLKIDFGALGSVRRHWKGVGVTLFINWAVKPFSMALLATFFLGWLFAPLLPAGEASSYIAGLIRLRVSCCSTAPCANGLSRASRSRKPRGCSGSSGQKRASSIHPTCRCPTR